MICLLFQFSAYFQSSMILQCMTSCLYWEKPVWLWCQSVLMSVLDLAKHCSKHQKSWVQPKSWEIKLPNQLSRIYYYRIYYYRIYLIHLSFPKKTWSCSECSKKALAQLQVLMWHDLSHLEWKKFKILAQEIIWFVCLGKWQTHQTFLNKSHL